jgi:hypothetical protein
MKILEFNIYLMLWFVFFAPTQAFTEGFAAGTLVKVPDGYEKIENLKIGDSVVCFDNEQKFVARPILFIHTKHLSQYARLVIDAEVIKLSAQQKIYNVATASWIVVSDLDNLCGSLIELKNDPIDLYVLSVAEYHNFFISKSDICVHNFIPAIVAGISFLFGSGIEIAGISFGLASLGTYLGYQWHKNKQSNVEIGCVSTSNPLSEDLHSNNDAQAPGIPTEKDGYHPPKNWDGKKIKHPRNGAVGWPDDKGNVWVPTGVGPKAHGGPHWDVQHPNGKDYENVYPGGKIR